MKSFAEWLVRGEQPKKKRKPMPKVSKRRVGANRLYSQKRKAFLEAHPFCQANGRILDWANQNNKELFWAMRWSAPPSCDIHHIKRRGKYLNDESTWLAVCRTSHDWIHNHPKEAKSIGLLA